MRYLDELIANFNYDVIGFRIEMAKIKNGFAKIV